MSEHDPTIGRSQPQIPPTRERARLTAIVVSIGALAWLAMVLFHGGDSGGWHANFGRDRLPSAQWLAGWAIMVVAMMLPPALPFLTAMSKLAQGVVWGRALVGVAAAVFVAAWVLVGIVLVVAAGLLTSLLADLTWLADRSAAVSGVAAILVGLYQFSPLKQACLTACRSPTGIMLIAWDSDRPWRSTIEIALRYALVCIGCCWTLMLLTLVVGSFVLPLMAIVSVIMLLERLLPSVRPLIPIQAALACAIGILLLFGTLPPGLGIGGGSAPHIHHTHGK
jgi:predicted metal-binding membrane protein